MVGKASKQMASDILSSFMPHALQLSKNLVLGREYCGRATLDCFLDKLIFHLSPYCDLVMFQMSLHCPHASLVFNVTWSFASLKRQILQRPFSWLKNAFSEVANALSWSNRLSLLFIPIELLSATDLLPTSAFYLLSPPMLPHHAKETLPQDTGPKHLCSAFLLSYPSATTCAGAHCHRPKPVPFTSVIDLHFCFLLHTS